eukprot:1566678-Pyramimonas_sp.AAC.1
MSTLPRQNNAVMYEVVRGDVGDYVWQVARKLEERGRVAFALARWCMPCSASSEQQRSHLCRSTPSARSTS